jgi:Zn finger protein HypA/HybF involved in hydrogenase expression
MAVALEGAVIISYENKMLKWKKKCEKCGHVDNNTISEMWSGGSSTKKTTTYMCPKCKNNQKVVIQG